MLRFLVGAYSLVKKTGLLDLPGFQELFGIVYFLYKRHFEDPYFALLKARPELLQGGNVLDVGANIGYTAILFSRAIDAGFRVYAFEPESSNFEFLRRNIGRRSLEDRIVPIQAALGDRSGTVELWRNANHPADHRVFTPHFRDSGVDPGKAVPVAMTTIDQFVAARGLTGSICFIKIDVQGYELSVCQGMERTLADHPRLIVGLEYMPQAMLELGSVPSELPAFFRARGYRIHLVAAGGAEVGRIREASDAELTAALAGRGYVDILASRRSL